MWQIEIPTPSVQGMNDDELETAADIFAELEHEHRGHAVAFAWICAIVAAPIGVGLLIGWIHVDRLAPWSIVAVSAAAGFLFAGLALSATWARWASALRRRLDAEIKHRTVAGKGEASCT